MAAEPRGLRGLAVAASPLAPDRRRIAGVPRVTVPVKMAVAAPKWLLPRLATGSRVPPTAEPAREQEPDANSWQHEPPTRALFFVLSSFSAISYVLFAKAFPLIYSTVTFCVCRSLTD